MIAAVILAAALSQAAPTPVPPDQTGRADIPASDRTLAGMKACDNPDVQWNLACEVFYSKHGRLPTAAEIETEEAPAAMPEACRDPTLACASFYDKHGRPPTTAEIKAGCAAAFDGPTDVLISGTTCRFYQKHGRMPSQRELLAIIRTENKAYEKRLNAAFPQLKEWTQHIERCEDSGACVTVYVDPR